MSDSGTKTDTNKPVKVPRLLGNLNPVTAGDSSPVLVTRLAKELKEKHGADFITRFPNLRPSDSAIVDIYWERAAQYRLARRFCARHGGDYNPDGTLKPAAARGEKHLAAMERTLERLGGTPASRYSMGLQLMEAEDLALKMGQTKNGH